MRNILINPEHPDCLIVRKSIRKFLPTLPPPKEIEEAIQRAQRAPSYKNTQPWELVALVDSKRREELSQLLLKLLEEQAISTCDFKAPQKWPSSLQNRIDQSMQERSKALGVSSLSDPQQTKKSKQKNFSFFGAPVVLFFYQHRELNEWSILDAGMFIQNVMLALCEKGIGSVPQAYLVDYAKEIQEFLQIPQDRRLLLGMSIGYPDSEHALFSHYSPRENLENIFRWI